MVRRVDRKQTITEELNSGGTIEEEIGIFNIKEDENISGESFNESKKDGEINGGFIKAVSERQEREKKNKEQEEKENQERRIKLTEAANVLLSCLEPSSSRDIRLAAQDYKVPIGIYVLGLLNRLIKTVDIWDPDIEPEWEGGKVGYSQTLSCKYCGKVIDNPQNVKQLYCSNRCARRDRDYGKTGVIFPGDGTAVLSDVETDEKKWEDEQRRIGAI